MRFKAVVDIYGEYPDEEFDKELLDSKKKDGYLTIKENFGKMLSELINEDSENKLDVDIKHLKIYWTSDKK